MYITVCLIVALWKASFICEQTTEKNVSVENKVTASLQLVVCGYLGVRIASLPPLTMVTP